MDNNSTAPEDMLTVSEAARRLGRSIEQVRRYLREGKLPGRRIGQQWFIDESALRGVYTPSEPRFGTIRETAVMEALRPVNKEVAAGDIAALMRRVDRNREAIKRRLGGDLKVDVVELLRVDREEH